MNKEIFPNVPTDDAVNNFIAANPEYATWPFREVRALMMSQESDRLNPIRALRQQNETDAERRQYEER